MRLFKTYRQNRWKHNIPDYCIDIYHELNKEHNVQYYFESCGENIVDCFRIDGYLIKVDRILTVSPEGKALLLEEIRNLHQQLKEIAHVYLFN